MSRIHEAAEILSCECDEARRQCDADPGNVLLAMRLSRLAILSSMLRTFGVGSDLASGYIPVEPEPQPSMDERSVRGDELAGSGCSVIITCARASERGRPEADDFSSRREQLPLPLDG